jgi:dTMP kinase
VIGGLDGAGLSTQATLLARYLRGKNKEVMLTKEPTSLPIGKLIKAALKQRGHLCIYC